MLRLGDKTYLTVNDLTALVPSVTHEKGVGGAENQTKDILLIHEQLPSVCLPNTRAAIYDADDFITWHRAMTAKARAEMRKRLADMNEAVDYVPEPVAAEEHAAP